jgi:hypothetical protein
MNDESLVEKLKRATCEKEETIRKLLYDIKREVQCQ